MEKNLAKQNKELLDNIIKILNEINNKINTISNFKYFVMYKWNY